MALIDELKTRRETATRTLAQIGQRIADENDSAARVTEGIIDLDRAIAALEPPAPVATAMDPFATEAVDPRCGVRVEDEPGSVDVEIPEGFEKWPPTQIFPLGTMLEYWWSDGKRHISPADKDWTEPADAYRIISQPADQSEESAPTGEWDEDLLQRIRSGDLRGCAIATDVGEFWLEPNDGTDVLIPPTAIELYQVVFVGRDMYLDGGGIKAYTPDGYEAGPLCQAAEEGLANFTAKTPQPDDAPATDDSTASETGERADLLWIPPGEYTVDLEPDSVLEDPELKATAERLEATLAEAEKQPEPTEWKVYPHSSAGANPAMECRNAPYVGAIAPDLDAEYDAMKAREAAEKRGKFGIWGFGEPKQKTKVDA